MSLPNCDIFAILQTDRKEVVTDARWDAVRTAEGRQGGALHCASLWDAPCSLPMGVRHEVHALQLGSARMGER